MAKYECLKLAMGPEFAARPGDVLELNPKDAKELVNDGALRAVASEAPKRRAKAAKSDDE